MDILAETEKIDIASYTLQVQSLHSLIALKTTIGRPKDIATIPILQQTLEEQT